jgi:hypothetical protein
MARGPHLCALAKHLPRDFIHRALVVFRSEQMSIAVHRDLQTAMAGEGLHGLRGKPGFDPARDREVPERMPIEARGLLGMRVGILGVPLG